MQLVVPFDMSYKRMLVMARKLILSATYTTEVQVADVTQRRTCVPVAVVTVP